MAIASQDDEAIFRSFLVAQDPPNLSELLERFQDDCADRSQYWASTLRPLLESHGFTYDGETQKPSDHSKDAIPAAFSSPEGQKHVKAVKALLGISPTANMPADKIGSQALLLETLVYHGNQASARWATVLECLKREIPMDSDYFLSWIVLASAPVPDWTRNQIEALEALSGDQMESIRIECEAQYQRNQRDALEGLSLLLYEQKAVSRTEYALVLLALQNSTTPYLSSLVGAECTALWRAEQSHLLTEEASEPWSKEHPLLVGLGEDGSVGERAASEVQALRTILLNQSAQNRQDHPESVALLSFGLLLSLADIDGGKELALQANAHALDFLYTALEAITPKNYTSAPSRDVDSLYDWQLTGNDDVPRLMQEDPAPDQTVYTSIAREVLFATLTVFNSALNTDVASENIATFCTLASKIYSRNPSLCEGFWNQWEANEGPMCHLLQASHELAQAAMEAYDQRRLTEDSFLPATAPFFRLLSSLAYSQEAVETTVRGLPPGLLRKSVLACRLPEGVLPTRAYETSRVQLLNSILDLASSSSTTRDLLRQSLEDPGTMAEGDGPRVLARILTAGDPHIVCDPVLEILSHLIDGSPPFWALQVTKELNSISLNYGDATIASLKVISGLLDHFSSIVFRESDPNVTLFLHTITSGVLAAGTALAASLSSTNDVSFASADLMLQCMATFLQQIKPVISIHESTVIRETAGQMRDSVIGTFASSTGLGQAIAYYATAPVALNMLSKLVNKPFYENEVAGFCQKRDATTHDESVWVDAQRSLENWTAANLNLRPLERAGFHSDKEYNATALNAAWSSLRVLSMWASHVEDIVSDSSMESKNLVESLSPQRLLASLAPTPSLCRQNNTLLSFWNSIGLSTLDLILPYVSADAIRGSAVLALDLIHVCMTQIRRITPAGSVGDSLFYRAIHRSPRFYEHLATNVKSTVSTLQKSWQTSKRESVLVGLHCLRVLSLCTEVNPRVADSALLLETEPLVPTLLLGAEWAMEILNLNTGSTPLFDSEASLVQMRVATGCISVLAGMWKTAREISSSQAGPGGSRLIDSVQTSAAFVPKLVRLVKGYANSIELDGLLLNTNDGGRIHCSISSFVSSSLQILASEAAYQLWNGCKLDDDLQQLLVEDFIQTRRFTCFDSCANLSAATSGYKTVFAESRAVGSDVVALLKCFPSISGGGSVGDFYSKDNMFDGRLAVQWIKDCCGRDGGNEFMEQLIVSYQQVLCDLERLDSWKLFSETMILIDAIEGQNVVVPRPSPERLFGFAQDTVRSLYSVVDSIEKAEACVSVQESSTMYSRMAELVLFFLELGLGKTFLSRALPVPDLLEILELLAKTIERVASQFLPRDTFMQYSIDIVKVSIFGDWGVF